MKSVLTKLINFMLILSWYLLFVFTVLLLHSVLRYDAVPLGKDETTRGDASIFPMRTDSTDKGAFKKYCKWEKSPAK